MTPEAIFQNARDTVMSDPSKLLGMTIGSHTVRTSGQQVPKADAQDPPTLYSTSLGQGTYVALALDLDAPYKSMPMMSPILHWLQPNLVPKPLQNGSFVLAAEAGAPVVANWLAPAPPPGASPHRYLFLLYEQPYGFDVQRLRLALAKEGKEVGMMKRVKWDLEVFVRENGLGAVVVANYFLCN